MNYALRLEFYVKAKHHLLRGRIGTLVDTHTCGRVGRSLRIETRIAADGEVVVERGVNTSVADAYLADQVLRQGVTKLDLLDLEIRTVVDQSVGNEILIDVVSACTRL